MTAEERREKEIAEIIGRLSGGRGHVRVQDAATAAYEAGRSAGLEDAAKVIDAQINAEWTEKLTYTEVLAAIRALKVDGK